MRQVKQGEWVQPIRRGYLLKCCDCGLVHQLNFRLVKHGRGFCIQFQAFRKSGDDKEKEMNEDQEAISKACWVIKERTKHWPTDVAFEVAMTTLLNIANATYADDRNAQDVARDGLDALEEAVKP